MAASTKRPKREMKVLSLGLPRTGSASVANALEILGYQGVYHALKTFNNKEDWHIINRAADASFPVLPTYTGKPFKREDWDELFGSYEASTDVAACFAEQMIETYPEAKVILVTRDFDRWIKSVDEAVIQQIWGPIGYISLYLIEPILGTVGCLASRKLMLGLTHARTPEEILQNAREAYERHHRMIRERVPPEQLLEYRMGDGWEPLCKFLGKQVPEEEFPWVNETAALKALSWEVLRMNAKKAAVKGLPWIGGLVVAAAGVWVALKK